VRDDASDSVAAGAVPMHGLVVAGEGDRRWDLSRRLPRGATRSRHGVQVDVGSRTAGKLSYQGQRQKKDLGCIREVPALTSCRPVESSARRTTACARA